MTTKNCAYGPKLVLKDLCEKSFVRNNQLPLSHVVVVVAVVGSDQMS